MGKILRQKFIEVEITADEFQLAEQEASDNSMRGNYQKSLHRGDNCLVGNIGEIAMSKVIPSVKYVNKVTHDYEHVDGYAIEVKSIKSNYRPNESYFLLLPSHKLSPMSDDAIIIVVQVLSNFSKAFICGAIKKSTFLKRATLKNKGEVQKPGFKYHNDCYELSFKYLTGLMRG